MLYKKLLRPILFRFDPESVHRFAMGVLGLVLALPFVRALSIWRYRVRDAALEQTLWGLDFENPVGLAAGFDKNAEHFNDLAALGFGFVEIGTVTGEGQPGNERPRMFRLPADGGLLNRMGFNNHGSAAVAGRLAKKRIDTVLGVNIGKTKAVPLAEAAADYEKSFRRLFDFARYFVVNVSSPNTPGLRELQNKEPLTELLERLQRLNAEMAAQKSVRRRPLLLKIAPDITDGQLDDILEVVERCDLDGIIATNTTIERDELTTPGQEQLGSGGVSGAPVRARSLELIRQIYRRTDGELLIIGVGGIFTAEDALETIEAGASLVQLWTGFVYEGPAAVRRINDGLVAACEERGWSSISQAVGVSVDAGNK
ncbi:MAG: quinone-dependent dihydroorotate dehydrogenase [Persicimonas sp.]